MIKYSIEEHKAYAIVMVRYVYVRIYLVHAKTPIYV